MNNNTVISMVKDAAGKATREADPLLIVGAIASGKYRIPVENIRAEYNKVLRKKGDTAAAKRAVDELKKRLAGVMWSGLFKTRDKDVPLDKKLVKHSGFLCADLDDLGERLAEVRTKLATSPHLWCMFSSPTAMGLKAVFRVNPDATKHLASFKAVERHVRALTGVAIDSACKEVVRLCFVSFDPTAYLNEKASALAPLAEEPKPPPRGSTSTPDLSARQRIAVELLGPIDWTSDTKGFCVCPGQHLHTTANDERDCEVHLDGAPNIHCFHSHCQGICDAINRELQSRIGKAEFTKGQGQSNTKHSDGGFTPAENAENAENAPLPPVDWDTNSANSANSATLYGNQKAIYPPGGFLQRYMDFARGLYESADTFLLSGLLPVAAAALGRRVWVRWQGGRLYPNVYVALVGPPASGKSDAFKLPELLARDVLGQQHLLSHRMSRESLFDAYLNEPNRLLLVDDANELFALWKASGYGEAFGAAFLRLFDCKPLTQDFRSDHPKGEEGVTSTDHTCTSLGLGLTYNYAKLDGLPQRSGLERRLLRSVAEHLERFIAVPDSAQSTEFNGLKERFNKLRGVSAEFNLRANSEALALWVDYQKANRVQLARCGDDEGLSARTRTAPTYALKLGMLFELDAWLERGGDEPKGFSPSCLECAFRHINEALRMSAALDVRAQRGRIDEFAEVLISKVRVYHGLWNWPQREGTIWASRSDITSRFAHDSGRPSSPITTEDIYLRILPRLIERNEARLVKREGKHEVYAFRLNPPATTQAAEFADNA